MSGNFATTRLSSKGQVVIPEEVRKSLGLKEGDQFVVIGKGDAVILKTITQPALEGFEELLKEAQKQAKKAGLKRSDIQKAIEKVRKRK
ncbi:MAG: AbrB/MazE/SpoVT family DNA-binding domain-containing protein [Fibrobacter sp.]|nr:AbrB/MazE/SpoVT family DNA-binding domain-containing protein [Fibrobacter sp.]